ncbi:MAG: hypothetical protein JNM98_03430 [Rhodocyclaceae bacterium]|nr:hypothetical protein [Rhodocyclaceae bacterium]
MTFAKTLDDTTAHALKLSFAGAAITVSADGATLGTYGFNSALVDGGFGLVSFGGNTSFDSIAIRTNDPAFQGAMPATPMVSVGDTVMLEGAAGTTTTAEITVTLSEAATTATTVDWTTVNGSAIAGVDYSLRSGTVTFAAGSTSATISVPIIGDGQWEYDETFNIVLSNPVGLTLANDTGVVTITNDDAQPAVSVAATDATGAEAASNPIVFTVNRSANLVGDIVVNLAWAGSATLGADYTVSVSGGVLSSDRSTLTLASGSSGATLTVTPVDDTAVEPSETVTLTLNAGSGYAVGTASASGTIADNDGLPTLSVASASVTEGNTGTKTVAVTVSLSAPSASTVTVAYATASGTATAGTDYQSTSGTLTFAAGVTSKTINVTIIGDRVKESNETFQVLLSSPSGATIATGSATVTIVDDEKALTAAQPSSSDGQAQADNSAAPPAAPSQAELQAVTAEALRRLPLSDAERALLGAVSVSVADLPGLELGEYRDGAVLIDVDAAGNGWFVDPTPGDDREFGADGLADFGPATQRMDLLSVVAHELGHAAGLDHEAGGLMGETLAVGTRTLEPVLESLPAAAPTPTAQPDFAFATNFGSAAAAAPTAQPVIDWQGSYAEASRKKAAPATDSRWLGDFVNHLGRSEAQRNPNAALRVLLPVEHGIAPKVNSPAAPVL